jgi:hypothetical protein
LPHFQGSLALASFFISWNLVSLEHSARYAQAIPAPSARKLGQEPHFISYFSNMQAKLGIFRLENTWCLIHFCS